MWTKVRIEEEEMKIAEGTSEGTTEDRWNSNAPCKWRKIKCMKLKMKSEEGQGAKRGEHLPSAFRGGWKMVEVEVEVVHKNEAQKMKNN